MEAPSAAAFERFFTGEYASAVRLAHLLTGDDSVAEDIAQEAFAGVEARFDRLENPAAFLRRCVINGCHSHHRRGGREARRLQRIRPEESAELGADELLDALDRLPHRQRAVLVLRYYEDRTEAEIADVLGCRLGTVKSLASRALDRLRQEVQP